MLPPGTAFLFVRFNRICSLIFFSLFSFCGWRELQSQQLSFTIDQCWDSSSSSTSAAQRARRWSRVSSQPQIRSHWTLHKSCFYLALILLLILQGTIHIKKTELKLPGQRLIWLNSLSEGNRVKQVCWCGSTEIRYKQTNKQTNQINK